MLKICKKLQEKRFVFVKILAIIIPENGAKVSKIKCLRLNQQTLNNGTIIEQGKPEDICLKYNQKNVMTLTLKDGKKLVFPNAPAYAAHVARLIQEEQITSIHSSEPTLEQVFLHLTGRSLL